MGVLVFCYTFRSQVSCPITHQAESLCHHRVAAVEPSISPAGETRLQFFGLSECTPRQKSRYYALPAVRAIFFVLDFSDLPASRASPALEGVNSALPMTVLARGSARARLAW